MCTYLSVFAKYFTSTLLSFKLFVHLFSSENLCILMVVVVLVLQITRLRDQVVLKSHVNFWP